MAAAAPVNHWYEVAAVPAGATESVMLGLRVVGLLRGWVVIDAAALRVTVALPVPAAGQLAASLTEVTVYVVDAAGLTLRDAIVPLLMVCVTLSDQVTLNGAVPVSVAVIVVDAPGQIVPPPLTAAAGSVFTVIVAEPLDVPVQFASVSDLTV